MQSTQREQTIVDIRFCRNWDTMPRAYSEDLRWRAVWLHVVYGMSIAKIAEVLFMAERSIYRYLAIFNSSGTVDPKDYKSGPKEPYII